MIEHKIALRSDAKGFTRCFSYFLLYLNQVSGAASIEFFLSSINTIDPEPNFYHPGTVAQVISPMIYIVKQHGKKRRFSNTEIFTGALA